mgnify:CR=1 FL=1
MDPQLRAQLRQTIYLSQVIGRDDFNQPVYGSPQPVACRISDLQKSIEDVAGNQVVAFAEIVVDVPVNLEDRIWLPGDNPEDPNAAKSPKNRHNLTDEFGHFAGCKVWV